MRKNPRIFISHSSKDNKFGKRIVQDLREALGSDDAVWYDTQGGLNGGDVWWREIVQELKQSDIFILIISPEAMESEWIRREFIIALTSKKHIIPLLYRKCEIWIDLKIIQAIDFLSPIGYKSSFEQLMKVIGMKPLGTSDPVPGIFISHSSKDDTFGSKLVNDLKNAIGNKNTSWRDSTGNTQPGNALWYDSRGGLQGGDNWWDKVMEELKARPIFIIILSPDAMNSGWVKDELHVAWQHKNSSLGKRIIPIVYKSCKTPDYLNTIHHVSFENEQQYDVSLQKLLHVLDFPTHA